MTVAQALALWPKSMATHLQLASPAVATRAAAPEGWLDRFMNGVAERHYRVNFIALHWYGADFDTAAAISELRSFLEAVHDLYRLPIWLMEYSLIDFAPTGPVYPTAALQASFVTASTKMLERLTFVQRYALFALPARSSGPSTSLYKAGPELTQAGLAFAQA